ncbi:hypothetical protein M8J77_001445 [Diaphorina citri]|nr:hypothetical protein M8J77_001445 [Diaphorina citri]
MACTVMGLGRPVHEPYNALHLNLDHATASLVSLIINFDSPRGGISLVTEKGTTTTSKLLIQKAVPKDSGIYACEPTNMTASSVRVHILDGEHQAAMHHGHGSSLAPPIITALITQVILHWHLGGA